MNKDKILSTNNIFIIFFITIYIFCNVFSQALFPSQLFIFVLAKVIPLVLVFVAILLKGQININFYVKIWTLSLIFFLIIAFISSLFSEDPFIVYRTLFSIMFLTIPLILFLSFITSIEKFELMIRIISIIYLSFSFYILYVHYVLSPIEIAIMGTIGTYAKGSVSNFILLGLSLCFLEKNLFKLLIFTTSIMLIYISLSVKLFLLLALFLFLMFFSLNKKNIIIIFAVIFFLFFLSYYLPIENYLEYIKIFNPKIYFFVVERILVIAGSTNVSDYAYFDSLGNIDLRLKSFRLFFNNPIFGIGLENERVSEVGTQAHNAFISILVGTGLLGFVCFYFFIFYVFFKSFKYKYDDVLKLVLIYLSYSIVNPTYSNGPATLLYFIIISLFVLKRVENLNRS